MCSSITMSVLTELLSCRANARTFINTSGNSRGTSIVFAVPLSRGMRQTGTPRGDS